MFLLFGFSVADLLPFFWEADRVNKKKTGEERREMKKAMKWGVICGLAFILAACGESNELGEESPFGEEHVNTLEGISMEMDQETYASEGDTFELIVNNQSDNEITYGVEFILEYKEDGTWMEVIPDDEREFIMLAHILDPDQEAQETIDLSYYEPLESGEYRIMREFEGEPVVAEFTVEE